ncbi:MAG TPA: YicC/YloC family endoribonuclease [Methylomirabilota bacterium]|nr:YicC/YloC family endoribonuclease [Methylomirabilota bacterium]
MTGYGRAEAGAARAALTVECKSVNHRHLDIALKFPRALASLEMDARRLVQSRVARGRVDISAALGAPDGGALNALQVNVGQAREYAEAARRVARDLELGDGPTLAWLLAQPGVLAREEQAAVSPDEAWPLLERALTAALAELVARREAEGQALAQELGTLHDALRAQVDAVVERAPAAVERRAARLRERIQALLGDARLDESRVATEVAVWAERTDISEELARVRAHLGQFRLLLAGGGAVGRTLDFLIQEMNREVNTVGAKADDLEISQVVIAAKSALEKMREQVQNIE